MPSDLKTMPPGASSGPRQADNGTLLVAVHTFEKAGDNAAEIRPVSAREATRLSEPLAALPNPPL